MKSLTKTDETINEIQTKLLMRYRRNYFENSQKQNITNNHHQEQ